MSPLSQSSAARKTVPSLAPRPGKQRTISEKTQRRTAASDCAIGLSASDFQHRTFSIGLGEVSNACETGLMTPGDFRDLALALPGAVEASHMRHPDFRVGNRIFATLGYPDGTCAMVKLKPDQQAFLVATRPDIFKPARGGWGLRGSTSVSLFHADKASIESALSLAWRNLVSARVKPAVSATRARSKPTKARRAPRD